MADVDVHVRSATDSWCDVVDRVVNVLVNAGLKTERTDDSRVVMLIGCVDERLSEFEGSLKEGLTDGCGIVADHGHLRDHLMIGHRHLLRSGEPHMAIEARLESPIHTQ